MSTNQSVRPAPRSTSSPLIPTGNLNSRDFVQYGQVIRNPARSAETHRLQKTVANQGTATKWQNVTNMTDFYSLAPSKKPAKVLFNMFVCAPRELDEIEGRKAFPVKILERHPYTPQTFVPLGVSAEDQETRYLVVVAPTLQSKSSHDRPKPYPAEKPVQSGKSLRDKLLGGRPNPYTNDYVTTTTLPDTADPSSESRPKGSGEPDLDHLQAFIARGDQAVTYAPGTWHAPMVVLGQKDIDFVVVQYANGVAMEDCQEFDVKSDIAIDINQGGVDASGPGVMRAKL